MASSQRIINEHLTSIEFTSKRNLPIESFYYHNGTIYVQTAAPLVPGNIEMTMLSVIDSICSTTASAADFDIDYRFEDGLLVFAGWYNIPCINWVTMGHPGSASIIPGVQNQASRRKFMVIPLNVADFWMPQCVRQWGYMATSV